MSTRENVDIHEAALHLWGLGGAMENATQHGQQHPEAFMLMGYESDDGRERLEVWNSRDGVTPFVISHPDTGADLIHVRWAEDRYLGPDHEPAQGDWIFANLTWDQAQQAAGNNAAKWWDHPEYPASKQFAAIEDFEKILATDYFGDGTMPHLTQVVG